MNYLLEGLTKEAVRIWKAGVDQKRRMDSGDQILEKTLYLWACSGLPRLECGHKLAAELCLTGISPEAADDIEPPWSAFFAHVPAGMFRFDFRREDDSSFETDVMAVMVAAAPMQRMTAAGEEAGALCRGLFLTIFPDSPRGRVVGMTVDNGFGRFVHDADNRHGVHLEDYPFSTALNVQTWELLIRFLLGLMIELYEHRPDVASAPRPHRGPPQPPKPGKTPSNLIRLDRTVSIDLRPEIVAILANARTGGGSGKGIPTVRTRVRAHWRNQAHGPGRTQRKWIRIQSFWRGDESAPISSTLRVVKG